MNHSTQWIIIVLRTIRRAGPGTTTLSQNIPWVVVKLNKTKLPAFNTTIYSDTGRIVPFIIS